MKIKNIFLPVILFIAILAGFTSCYGDSELQPPPGKINSQGSDIQGKFVDSEDFGNLQLTVSPRNANASITVYNDVYNSTEIFPPSNEDAAYYIEHIPVGKYSILVRPYNEEYDAKIVEDVYIKGNETLDLGNIEL